MRIRTACLIGVLAVALSACSRQATQQSQTDADQKSAEHMRQAGRAAYNAAQKAEDAARDLSRQVERAGKEAQQGWDEAKREHEQQKNH